MNLAAVTEEFLRHMTVERNASPLTLISYRTVIRYLLAFVEREGIQPLIHKLTTPILRRFLSELQETYNWKPATLNRYTDTLKSLFRYCHEQEYLDSNPMARIYSPRVRDQLPRHINADELARLLDVVVRGDPEYRLRDKAILYLLIQTGLRRAEVLSLTWDDVNLDAGTIRVQGKGRRERLVPLTHEVKDLLYQYLMSRLPLVDRALFLNREERPLQRTNLHDLVKKYLRRAGIQASCHSLRHTYANPAAGGRCRPGHHPAAARPSGPVHDPDLPPCQRRPPPQDGREDRTQVTTEAGPEGPASALLLQSR